MAKEVFHLNKKLDHVAFIMTYLISMGLPSQVSFSIMEDVRHGKKLKKEYSDLMRAHNVPQYYLDSCNKIHYLFPRAHATAYVMMAVRVGYFKVYFPLEYYAVFFSVRSDDWDIKAMIGGEEPIIARLEEFKRRSMNRDNPLTPKEENINKTLQIALEMVERGYKFENIDLYRSSATAFVVDHEHNSLIPPFGVLDGLGSAAGESIVEARKAGPFLSKEDLLKRAAKLNGTNLKDLSDLGVLDGLGETNQMSLFEFMDLPEEQITLVNELAKVNSNIVVVLSCGSPVELPFLSKIRGLFLIYLGGEGASEGLFRLLVGKQSPSGHLAETWPLHYYDVPNREFYPGRNRQALYKEGLFVGYRFYGSCEKEVAFPFGFGLTYSSFKYGLLDLSSPSVKDSSPFVVSLSVENVSEVAGKCVIELYVHPIGSHLVRPFRELKAFKKIFLKPHEKQEVAFDLDWSIFSHYDVKSHSFAVEPLTYRIEIGESSLDIRSSRTIEVSSSYKVENQRSSLPDYYFVSGRGMDVPQIEFEALLGHSVPTLSNPKVRPFGMNSTLSDIDGTLIGKIAKKLIVKSLTKNAKSEAEKNMTLEGSLSSPFRAGTMAGVKENYLAAVVDLANRKPFKAIHHLLFGVKR